MLIVHHTRKQKSGSEIELVCEGPDEEAALAHATELIESGLGE